MFYWLKDLYSWFKSHDLPNWIIFIFTTIFWPIILYYYSKRKRWNIPNLIISRNKYEMEIDKIKVPALKFKITNRTNNTVFITQMRIKGNRKNFQIYLPSTIDIGTGYYELLFMNESKTNEDNKHPFNLNDIVLRPNEYAITAIGLQNNLDDKIYTHSSYWFQKLFNCYKFFVLEYTTLVGNKSYRVKTIY